MQVARVSHVALSFIFVHNNNNFCPVCYQDFVGFLGQKQQEGFLSQTVASILIFASRINNIDLKQLSDLKTHKFILYWAMAACHVLCCYINTQEKSLACCWE